MRSRFETRFGHLPVIEAAEIGRPRFRLRNPIVAGMLEIITQALYDYYEVALANVTTLQNLFTIPVGGAYTPTGGAVFNKRRIHTNLVQAGQLEAPNKHLTRAVGVYVRGDITPNDLNRFCGAFLLTFNVNQKRYLEGLVGKFPAGGGGFSSTTQNNVGIAQVGWPETRNLYVLEHDGVQIEQQQNFGVDLDPTQIQGGAFTTDIAAANPAGTGIRAWVHLEGTLARAVQ